MAQHNDFVQALKNIAKTKDGETVLESLKESYIKTSCIAETNFKTFYNLGQTELVQHLINLIEDDGEIV